MGRIRVLSDTVANKIAAGEVVERPSSVVKELLENSLDAGASEIRVDTENGGRRLIRVADDGCGMMRDDALLAFERHATSKLADVRDLLSVATLGFRGEALPSIASVSRLLLETRSAPETTGTEVEIAGGRLLRCDECRFPQGTTITVRDLFFNVPARKKFLRSEQTELAHIASLVTHYSLAHPGRAFSLRHGPNTLLDAAPVGSLAERLYQVFGSRVLDDLVDLGCVEHKAPPAGSPDDAPVRAYTLRGFVSGPQVQKLNRNSIYLFVNGRLIRDRLLLHALSAAYHNLMPPACYPFALLFLDCDPEEVDVNVHPAKTEVRFRQGSVVHDFVRDAIRARLMESRPAAAIAVSDFHQTVTTAPPEGTVAGPETGWGWRDQSSGTTQDALPSYVLKPSDAPPPRFDFGPGAMNIAAAESTAAAPSIRLPVPETHGAFPAEALPVEDAPGTLEGLRDLRPLGQLHDSFIVAAGRDGLWIVDQHVAHERILFEQVLAQWERSHADAQHLLMPIVVELTTAQQVEFTRIAGELQRAGFEAEPFGHRTVAVKSAPAGIGAPDIEQLLFEILEIAEQELRRVSLDDLRRALAATVACRAAIKINTPLDMAKMEWLLGALAATQYPMSCPHGRPIALRYSTRDILRSFHRI